MNAVRHSGNGLGRPPSWSLLLAAVLLGCCGNLAAQIEVSTSPDCSKTTDARPSADETLSCALPPGSTMFVVCLAQRPVLDRFTFINENSAARGEVSIAVSNFRLPAASEKWVKVEGSVPFSGKRFLSFSLLGVEAKYVRLNFRTQRAGRIAMIGLDREKSLQANARPETGAREAGNKTSPATASGGLDLQFADLYAGSQTVFVSSGESQSAAAVAPPARRGATE